ncbi:uncharacterized protein LOC134262924 [Saccostrea cucullata]|uniref:uncharacterized protein LOC134262924 n=1 Tax=Saccostrea cuccullata TaxID=36930 RepID=UPI002ED67CCE
MTFIRDCLDAFLLTACMEVLDIKSLDEKPKRTILPELLHLQSKEDQYDWIKELCFQILDTFVYIEEDSLPTVTAQAAEMDNKELLMSEMYQDESKQYVCTCNRKYKTKGHFKRHLQNEHNWVFHTTEEETPESATSKQDHIALWRSSFMKLALLLRDTEDAFKFGDGTRIFRNAKFEMMCADIANHSKYKLCLWRLLAYECSLLSPREAFEYKWNCSSNIHGGTGKNIPNDNLVEICVHVIKKKTRQQGANLTYESAKKIASCVQMQEEIKSSVQKQLGMKTSGQSKPTVDKKKDLQLIIMELKANDIFSYIPGREFSAFKSFQDIFSRVNVVQLHKWITKQKERASYEQ